MAILLFVAILFVVVMIHELGHFLMAKRSGIGVEEFGFGLPPRIWGKKIGETIYSINWLPFGGFVRLVGEDDTSAKNRRSDSFQVKSVGARILVVVAGVFANFMLAVVLFYIVLAVLGFKTGFPTLVEHKFILTDVTNQVFIAGVNPNSAAAKAEIKPGDSVIFANGEEISSTKRLQEVIRGSDGKNVSLTLENTVNNQKREVQVTPVYNEELKAPALGIELGELTVLNYKTPVQKALSGFSHSYNTLTYTGKIFGRLIGSAFAEKTIAPVSEGVSGPVGIFTLVRDISAFGVIPILQLVALLSLNLAVINILPIPAVDGGRLAFIIFEGITRRRVSPVVEKWIHTVGFAVLIGLILLVTYNDILKLLR